MCRFQTSTCPSRLRTAGAAPPRLQHLVLVNTEVLLYDVERLSTHISDLFKLGLFPTEEAARLACIEVPHLLRVKSWDKLPRRGARGGRHGGRRTGCGQDRVLAHARPRDVHAARLEQVRKSPQP
jgi:hypothetical protein